MDDLETKSHINIFSPHWKNTSKICIYFFLLPSTYSCSTQIKVWLKLTWEFSWKTHCYKFYVPNMSPQNRLTGFTLLVISTFSVSKPFSLFLIYLLNCPAIYIIHFSKIFEVAIQRLPSHLPSLPPSLQTQRTRCLDLGLKPHLPRYS